MNIETLKAYDTIYGLRLKPEDYALIEEEKKHPERTGHIIIAHTRYRGKKYMITYDYKKGSISIHELDTHNLKEQALQPGSRVVCKTECIGFTPAQRTYALNRAFGSEALYTVSKAHSQEEMDETILRRLVAREILDISSPELNYIAELFKEKPFKNIRYPTDEIREIFHVFQKNNYRLAVFINKFEEEYWTPGGTRYNLCRPIGIIAFTPKEPEYNYVCPRRKVYDNIWVSEDIKNISKEELKEISNTLPPQFFLLTPETYAQKKSELAIKILAKKKQEQVYIALTKEKQERLNKFRRDKKYTQEGITFEENKISYQDYSLECLDPLPEITKQIEQSLIDKDNFASAAHKLFIKIVGLKEDREWTDNPTYKPTTPRTKIKINGKETEIYPRNKTYYINYEKTPYRINKESLISALEIMLTLDHDARKRFLEQASKYGLQMLEALKDGMTVKLSYFGSQTLPSPIQGHCTINLNFKLCMKNKRPHAIINGKPYKITDSGLFQQLKNMPDGYRSNTSHIERMISILMRSVKGINPMDIDKMLKEAKKNIIKKERRSLRFLHNAIRLAKAETVQGGWLIKSQSGNFYHVCQDLKVYHINKDNPQEKKYLCLLDSDRTDLKDKAMLNDALAKRILAMHKDQTVATDIWNAGDHMDRHWQEIK